MAGCWKKTIVLYQKNHLLVLTYFKDATIRLVASHDRNVANDMAGNAGADGTALNSAFLPSSLHKENLTDETP